jgi:hypothetical protein
MRGILIAILAVLLLGGIAGVAYQAGVAAGAAATGAAGTAAVAAYPYMWHPFAFGFGFFGFLFPLLFIFLIFGLVRAAFWGGRGYGYGMHRGGPRMFDEWHKEAHEHGTSGSTGGKAES